MNRSMGQSLVETALVLPFLLTLIFGVFELGRIVFVFSAVNNASREATRYGASTGSTLGGVPRYLNCSAIRQAAIDTAFLAGLTDADIEIHYDEPAGNDMQVYAHCVGGSARDIGTNAIIASEDVSPGDRVVVTVRKRIDPILPIFPSFNPTFVTARTILKDIAIGPPECSDGVDNDNDGAFDFPDDDGCTSSDDTTETICYRLFVIVLPEDGGQIGYNPGTNCANRYIEQTGVNVEAIPDVRNDSTLRPEYTFDYWQGPVDTGDGSKINPTTVTVDGNKDVTAHFRRVEADLIVIKSATPDPVVSGKSLVYVIDISNAGVDTAHEVTITDILPNEVAYDRWSSSDGITCDDSALPTIVCTLSQLNSGSNAIVRISVIAPVAGGGSMSVDNTVTVAATEYDPNLENNTYTFTSTVEPLADLSIFKQGPPGSVQADALFDYIISITNAGPSVATNVVVSDILDSSLTYESSSDCTYEQFTPREVRCEIPQILANNTVDVTFRVRAPKNGTTVSNTATVSSDATDDDTSDNNSTTTTVVVNHANLSLDKSGPSTATRDVDFDYTLVATNAGPSDASGVTIVDRLPDGVQFNSATNDYGSCTASGNIVTCSVGSIRDGQSRQVLLNVTPITDGTKVNQASVNSSITDPSTGNNSDSTTTEVTTDVGLNIVKSASASAVNEGDTLSYSIQVSNNGPSTATNVELADTLPAGVTYQGIDSGSWTCDDASAPTITCWPTDNLLVAGQGTTIVITVSATDSGTIHNSATLTSDEKEVSDSTSVTVSSILDLSLSVNAPMTAIIGALFTFDLNIDNSGPSDATSAQVISYLDPDVLFSSAAAPPGWTCNYDSTAHMVSCPADGPFAPGNATISISVTPRLTGIIFSEGLISANESSTDTNPDNDSDSRQTTVQ